MRKFVFYNKSEVEMNIITDVLYEEKILYKIKKFIVKDFIFNDDEEDEDFCIIEEMYNIYCFTDLEHFDFVKHVAYNKIENRMKLEKFYMLEPYQEEKKVSKKHVQRVSKKNTANTNRKRRSKPKE